MYYQSQWADRRRVLVGLLECDCSGKNTEIYLRFLLRCNLHIYSLAAKGALRFANSCSGDDRKLHNRALDGQAFVGLNGTRRWSGMTCTCRNKR